MQSLTMAPLTRLLVPRDTTNLCMGRLPVLPRHPVTTLTQKEPQNLLIAFQAFGLIRQDSLNVWRPVPVTIQIPMRQLHRYLAPLASITLCQGQTALLCVWMPTQETSRIYSEHRLRLHVPQGSISPTVRKNQACRPTQETSSNHQEKIAKKNVSQGSISLIQASKIASMLIPATS